MKTAFVLLFLLAGCAAAPRSNSDDSARALASQMVEAHGGLGAWNALTAMTIEREHVFEPDRERRFEFTIDADLHAPRMEQWWRTPPGHIVWDGARDGAGVEASEWPMGKQLHPAFVMSIGFYLVNMPWLAGEPDARIERLPPASDLAPGDTHRYERLALTYTAPMLDDGSEWGGDLFVVYIDPETHRLRGVKQHRRWPPQMQLFGLSEGEEFFQVFVVDTEVTQSGLILPDTYRVYDGENDLVASGRFGPYSLR
ncbi:MAG: hypothetical protein KC729_08520 [Candidatus Eisenbacteria bacterium]|uniref:Lipoprotein n=1 Tax=Eiseniibacteriota bacterium TaxID=2212470 RepID=A0A956LY49_UNCEI|nr:hypothetical protein [Candidatus Eisenbacteria bacterium]